MPVLLSVGYAACHWCHVMAHESFEDDATAAYLNEHFVSIKVDREERPDVDAVYMQATTAMTGHGGWPMTVRARPRRQPVLRRHLLPRPAAARAAGVPAGAGGAGRGLARPARRRTPGGRRRCASTCAARRPRSAPAPIDRGRCSTRRSTLLGREFDGAHGGFGGAPEVPAVDGARAPAAARRAPATRRAGDARRDAARRWRAAASTTSSAAASRATPSTARWVVPHFEKMLYDNAQLLGVYARWGTPLGDRVAAETADFLVRELGTAEGGFASALDADCEGEEGRFYVWTPAAAGRRARRGRRRAGRPALFEVTAAGTFEHGTSTLQLLRDPDDLGAAGPTYARRLLAARERAGAAGPRRQGGRRLERPGDRRRSCDAGRLLGREEYVDAAVAAGTLLAELHLRDDGSAAAGSPATASSARHRGVLEDHGCVARGFLALRRRDRRRGLARPGAARCSTTRSTQFRRRRRRLLRHRRRRRGAGRPAARPVRQRQPVGHSRPWCTRWSPPPR